MEVFHAKYWLLLPNFVCVIGKIRSLGPWHLHSDMYIMQDLKDGLTSSPSLLSGEMSILIRHPKHQHGSFQSEAAKASPHVTFINVEDNETTDC